MFMIVTRRRGVPVAYPAPRRHDRCYGIGVELAGDGQTELGLVKEDGGFQVGVEIVGEVGVGEGGEVAEAAEVLLEVGHAGDVAAFDGV